MPQFGTSLPNSSGQQKTFVPFPCCHVLCEKPRSPWTKTISASRFDLAALAIGWRPSESLVSWSSMRKSPILNTFECKAQTKHFRSQDSWLNWDFASKREFLFDMRQLRASSQF